MGSVSLNTVCTVVDCSQPNSMKQVAIFVPVWANLRFLTTFGVCSYLKLSSAFMEFKAQFTKVHVQSHLQQRQMPSKNEDSWWLSIPSQCLCITKLAVIQKCKGLDFTPGQVSAFFFILRLQECGNILHPPCVLDPLHWECMDEIQL